MMDRRRFLLTSLAGTFAASLIASAQGAVPRIGILAPGSPTPGTLPMQVFDEFRRGLRDLGYIEGRNVSIEPRWDKGRPESHATLVADLLRLKVDIILAGTTATAIVASKATRSIPIVMAATGGDPVALGLAASLPRPGGNVTVLTLQTYELPGKRLQLLKEALPNLSRLAVLWHPTEPSPAELKQYDAVSRSLGLQLHPVEVRRPEDFDAAFQTVAKSHNQAVIMVQSALYAAHRKMLAEIALKAHLPTMSGETGFAQSGGLMNYGPNIPDSWRRAAGYVDRIIKGGEARRLGD